MCTYRPTGSYCDRPEARDAAARTLGWVLPPVGAQAALARLAGTDLHGQLAYQDRVRAYHKDLRQFYYRYLFNDLPFRICDFAKAPTFDSDVDKPDTSASRK